MPTHLSDEALPETTSVTPIKRVKSAPTTVTVTNITRNKIQVLSLNILPKESVQFPADAKDKLLPFVKKGLIRII